MKRLCVSAVLVAVFSIVGFSQDASQVVSTSTVEGARFEMVQPLFDRNLTFRLDKFTGSIHRLSTCPKDDSIGSDRCWKEMIVIDQPRTANTGRIRFQIVVNGSSPRGIYLMQIDTGRTWQYGIEREDKWHPFIECSDRTNTTCLWRP